METKGRLKKWPAQPRPPVPPILVVALEKASQDLLQYRQRPLLILYYPGAASMAERDVAEVYQAFRTNGVTSETTLPQLDVLVDSYGGNPVAAYRIAQLIRQKLVVEEMPTVESDFAKKVIEELESLTRSGVICQRLSRKRRMPFFWLYGHNAWNGGIGAYEPRTTINAAIQWILSQDSEPCGSGRAVLFLLQLYQDSQDTMG